MSTSASPFRSPTDADNADPESPRLAPIDHPSSWKAKLTYAMARWQQGTVITPLKVLWARMPEGLRLAYEMNALEEAVVKSDGGGKVTVARRPVESREHITRFLLGIAEQAPENLEPHFVRVNGRPGLLATVDGKPQSVWFFHVRNGRIQNAYSVLNPEKLHHVDPPHGVSVPQH